jgi:sulfur carrier protein ThiS
MRLHLGGHLNWYDAQKRAWLTIRLAEPARLIDLLEQWHLPVGEVALTVINGRLVELAEARITDGDRVELYPPIGGGNVQAFEVCKTSKAYKSTMHPILKKLAGTDRRSIGKAEEVVADVLANPALFDVVLGGMLHDNPVIRMRAADAVEKITACHPEYLRPYKHKLIRRVSRIEQQEVRWHVAQLFSRLKLNPAERRVVVGILTEYLKDKSRIVKTFSMQALADLAEQDADLRPAIVAQLEELTRTGSPAMQSRGRKLLAKLKS